MIKIKDGEVRPEECICEPCSDISKIGGICEVGSGISCYRKWRLKI